MFVCIYVPELKQFLDEQHEHWDKKMSAIKEMYIQAFPSKQPNLPDNKPKKLSKKSRNKSVHAKSSEAGKKQVHLAATYAAKLQKEFYTMVGSSNTIFYNHPYTQIHRWRITWWLKI